MAKTLQLPSYIGGFMKSLQIKNLNLILLPALITLLSACGTKKSNETPQGSNATVISSQQNLASCNQATNAQMSYNLSVVTENNQINTNWLKLKFNFLSTEITQSNYSIRFYKWRAIGNSAQLDQNPLQFAAYNISTGQSTSNVTNVVSATQINTQQGFYINLNDDTQYPYQVLKVVAYKTDGTVAAQSDILIPQFLANPNDYKLNPDGSTRIENLTRLHPLISTDVGQWTQAQMQQNFDQYCF